MQVRLCFQLKYRLHNWKCFDIETVAQKLDCYMMNNRCCFSVKMLQSFITVQIFFISFTIIISCPYQLCIVIAAFHSLVCSQAAAIQLGVIITMFIALNILLLNLNCPILLNIYELVCC